MVEFCLVTHHIGAFIEDSGTDLDRKPDYMRVNGSVTLTPKLAKGDAVLVTDSEGVRTVPVVPIVASIVAGVLTHEGEPGVYVFAGGPNSNPETIVYTVTYSDLTAGKHKITLRSTSFEAIPGGEVDLAGLAPVAGSAGKGIARGEQGDPGQDGLTPHVGANGNWWIGDTDTGARAQGEKGEPGPKGASGDGSGDVLWSELNPVLDGKAASVHRHSWGDVEGKPSAYPPETHSHSQYAMTTTVNGVSSRVTTLENAQPIIVSSLPATPLPGRIYLVTG